MSVFKYITMLLKFIVRIFFLISSDKKRCFIYIFLVSGAMHATKFVRLIKGFYYQ